MLPMSSMVIVTVLFSTTCSTVLLLGFIQRHQELLCDSPPARTSDGTAGPRLQSRFDSHPTSVSAEQSYGYMEYDEVNWQRMQAIHKKQWKKNHVLNPAKSSLKGSVFYQINYEPTWSCPFEERVGPPGDGGKWVCDAFKIAEMQECLIISIGSNNDWSFENAVHELNSKCEIHTFDHTITPKNQPHFVTFHHFGLGPSDVGQILTLQGMLQKIGKVNTTVELFKIDCEHCEWNVYPQFFGGFLRQILIELHNAPPKSVHNFFEAMNDNGYVIYHKEPNTMGCRGNCIEYGFIKLNLKSTLY